MREMRKFIREELSGWEKWEVAWLLAACTVIAVLSIYWQDTIMGITATTGGLRCVYRKGLAYIFERSMSLYAIISFQARYWQVMLNALYYFPMKF